MPIPLQRVVQKTFFRQGSATMSASGTVGSYINQSPVAQNHPTISFTQGLGQDISIASLWSDPNPGEQVALAYIGVGMPNGVSFISATKVYRYDGVSAPGSTDLNQIRGTDNGSPPLSSNSNLHRVQVVASPLVWQPVGSQSFTQGTPGSILIVPTYVNDI
jgi:hypothetical protein